MGKFYPRATIAILSNLQTQVGSDIRLLEEVGYLFVRNSFKLSTDAILLANQL